LHPAHPKKTQRQVSFTKTLEFPTQNEDGREADRRLANRRALKRPDIRLATDMSEEDADGFLAALARAAEAVDVN
jgi:hypothetical protein